MANGFGQDPLMQQNMMGMTPPFAAMGQAPQVPTALSGLGIMQNPFIAMLAQGLMQTMGQKLGMRPFALSDQNMFDQIRRNNLLAALLEENPQATPKDLRTFLPDHDPAAMVKDTVEIAVQVNGKVRVRLIVAADADRETLAAAALADEKIAAELDGREPRKAIVVPGRLVNLVV